MNFHTKIIGSPIVRESDGLAMSSRNNLLTSENRKIAPKIYKQLALIRDNIDNQSVLAEGLDDNVLKYLQEQKIYNKHD